ncbi:microcin C transport system ATP-binding protein [Marinobacterium halophilum]|uniref:Microcin C transport system ATP-binding protein n=1 Tax=Marinobacterium halophilum TaxID=267374 RepID=A0A2P8F0D5_9GAMM|nr:ABC transporter ATP-binding protein [Marinobacterium halophilum]PSL15182.1 microcin C transport system ATP-binding protein [Marinobacterium halophilum]
MTSPLVSVNKLSVCFNGASSPAVKEVSFEIEAGTTLALVGESGSGKSVTALSLLRLLSPQQIHPPEGQILYRGEDLLQADESRLQQLRGNRVGIIFQEPMTSLNPLHTLEKQISETLRLHKGFSLDACRERVIELLTLVGIDAPEKRLDQYPHQLSGGQRQRVMIAMALTNEPELLIADEPTTALDVTIQQQILELLQTLQARFNMAILLISHDLNVVRRVADRICVMHQGAMLENQACNDLFTHPQHDYTRQLLAAEPEGSPTPVAQGAPLLLQTQGLQVLFEQRKGLLQRVHDYHRAVDGIDLQLRAGETLGIVGESGSGKTTLAMAILRLIRSHGDIHFKQHCLSKLKQKQITPLRKQIQVVFQDPYGSLSPRMNILEIIAEGLQVQGCNDLQQQEQHVCQALVDVGLDPVIRHRYPHEFSGGQRQRIAIARALVLKPELIILDEPTSALDRTVQKQIIELLRTLQQRYGLSYLFISHDLAVVRAMSHRVMVMQHGKIVESADTHALFAHPEQAYTRNLLDAACLPDTHKKATH